MRSFKLLSYKQDTPQLEEVCMAQMRGYYSCTCNVYISIYIGHLFRFSLVIWQLCMHCLEFCQPLLLRQKCLSSLSLVQTLSCERNVACVKNNPIVTLRHRAYAHVVLSASGVEVLVHVIGYWMQYPCSVCEVLSVKWIVSSHYHSFL